MKTFNLSHWAVTHQTLVLFLIIAITVGGIFSYEKLGRAEDPNFTIKVGVVTAIWPGATALEMQNQVTDRIEKKLQELPYFNKAQTYAKPGFSATQIEFKDSTPAKQVPELLVEVFATDRRQSEKVLPLADEDDHPDARGEPHDHRIRNEFDHRTEFGQAHRQQHESGHQGSDLQAFNAVLRGNARQDHDKRASRPGDLQSASAKERGGKPGNNRGVETLFRLGAGSNCKCHCQWQRDYANDHASDYVLEQVFGAENAGALCFENRNHRGRALQ